MTNLGYYGIFQWLVVALLVSGCALYCFFALAPKSLVSSIRMTLLRCPLPSFLRTRLQASLAHQGGCGGACHGCASAPGPRSPRRRGQ